MQSAGELSILDREFSDIHEWGCIVLSVRFVGGLGRFNPPLVEDDPTLVTENLCLGGRLRPHPPQSRSSMDEGWPSFCNGQTYREAAKASLPPNPSVTVFAIVISIVTEIAVVLPVWSIASSLLTFGRRLKTFLYQSSFDYLILALSVALIFS